VSNSIEKCMIWQVLQVLPGQPIFQPMAHPFFITTVSRHSNYPGKYKYLLLSSSKWHWRFKQCVLSDLQCAHLFHHAYLEVMYTSFRCMVWH